MYANLFEHETIIHRDKLSRIWDRVPTTLSCSAMEREFIRLAVAAGYDAETAEAFVMGDPSC